MNKVVMSLESWTTYASPRLLHLKVERIEGQRDNHVILFRLRWSQTPDSQITNSGITGYEECPRRSYNSSSRILVIRVENNLWKYQTWYRRSVLAVGSMAKRIQSCKGYLEVHTQFAALFVVNQWFWHIAIPRLTRRVRRWQMTRLTRNSTRIQSKNFKSEMWIQFKKLNLKTIPAKSPFVRFCLRQT